MKREQLIRRLRSEARAAGLAFSVNMARGKGGHCMVYVGDRTTIVPSGDISPTFEKVMRKQLGLWTSV